MLTPPTFPTFTAAYVAVLQAITHGPHYRTEGRGKNALELPNVSFTLDNPLLRMPYLHARRANPVFVFAEFLWYVSGRHDLNMISYYAPRLRNLSADGATMTGTAYGRRLFLPDGPDQRSQFQRALDLVVNERDSKRAAMLIMRPDELVDQTNPDVACTLALQLMLRDGRLHMTGYMRGNDAKIGLLCDVHSFTMIQEFAARLLRVEVGTYTHHVGSMHINTADLDQVDAILAEADGAAHAAPFPAPAMPANTSWDDITAVLAIEDDLRTNRRSCTPRELHDGPIDPYWQAIILLFEAYRQIQHTTDPVSDDVLDALHPGHRWLLAARWPTRVDAGEGQLR